MNITYGTHSIHIESLPATSLEALLRRGISHYLGNEQAAKVTNRKADYQAKHGEHPDDELVAAWKSEVQTAAVEKLMAGTIGQHAPRAPNVDPVEREAGKIALAEVRIILTNNGIKTPKKGEPVTFKNGSQATLEEMVARRLVNPTEGPRIMKEAEKAVKAAAAKKFALEAGDAGSADSADDLGL
jgi:hypothetical protein